MDKRKAAITLIVLAIMVIAAVVGASFVSSQIKSVFSFPGQALNPPTPTSSIRMGPTVIEAIRTQAKLETVSMTITKDMTIKRVHGFLGVCQEEITYLGYYTVTAGVDLRQLGPENVTVANDGQPELADVTITLPPAQVLHSELDMQNSRIVAQSSTNWIPGCSHQVADMTVEAQTKIQEYAMQAALQKGILDLATDRASTEIKRLLDNVGYRHVKIVPASSTGVPGPTRSPSPGG